MLMLERASYLVIALDFNMMNYTGMMSEEERCTSCNSYGASQPTQVKSSGWVQHGATVCAATHTIAVVITSPSSIDNYLFSFRAADSLVVGLQYRDTFSSPCHIYFWRFMSDAECSSHPPPPAILSGI